MNVCRKIYSNYDLLIDWTVFRVIYGLFILFYEITQKEIEYRISVIEYLNFPTLSYVTYHHFHWKDTYNEYETVYVNIPQACSFKLMSRYFIGVLYTHRSKWETADAVQKEMTENLTELVVLSSFRMSVSIFTVAEHFWSPAARQRTATHWAIENNACFATPPDWGDGLAVESRDSSNESKLVFAE